MVAVPKAPSSQPSQQCEVCRASIFFPSCNRSTPPFLSIVIRKPSFWTIFIVQKLVRAKRPLCATYRFPLILNGALNPRLMICLNSIVTRNPNFRGLITVVRNVQHLLLLPSLSILEPLPTAPNLLEARKQRAAAAPLSIIKQHKLLTLSN